MSAPLLAEAVERLADVVERLVLVNEALVEEVRAVRDAVQVENAVQLAALKQMVDLAEQSIKKSRP